MDGVVQTVSAVVANAETTDTPSAEPVTPEAGNDAPNATETTMTDT